MARRSGQYRPATTVTQKKEVRDHAAKILECMLNKHDRVGVQTRSQSAEAASGVGHWVGHGVGHGVGHAHQGYDTTDSFPFMDESDGTEDYHMDTRSQSCNRDCSSPRKRTHQTHHELTQTGGQFRMVSRQNSTVIEESCGHGSIKTVTNSRQIAHVSLRRGRSYEAPNRVTSVAEQIPDKTVHKKSKGRFSKIVKAISKLRPGKARKYSINGHSKSDTSSQETLPKPEHKRSRLGEDDEDEADTWGYSAGSVELDGPELYQGFDGADSFTKTTSLPRKSRTKKGIVHHIRRRFTRRSRETHAPEEGKESEE